MHTCGKDGRVYMLFKGEEGEIIGTRMTNSRHCVSVCVSTPANDLDRSCSAPCLIRDAGSRARVSRSERVLAPYGLMEAQK